MTMTVPEVRGLRTSWLCDSVLEATVVFKTIGKRSVLTNILKV